MNPAGILTIIALVLSFCLADLAADLAAATVDSEIALYNLNAARMLHADLKNRVSAVTLEGNRLEKASTVAMQHAVDLAAASAAAANAIPNDLRSRHEIVATLLSKYDTIDRLSDALIRGGETLDQLEEELRELEGTSSHETGKRKATCLRTPALHVERNNATLEL